MGNIPDVLIAITAARQQKGDILQVSNRVDIIRTLFFSKCSVQVLSYADVQRISRKLADVVHVIDEHLQVAIHLLRF